MGLFSFLNSKKYVDYFLVCAIMCIIPLFYFVEVYLVLTQLYENWCFWYILHFGVSLFLLHNVVGNYALGLQGPGNVRDNFVPTPLVDLGSWRFCSICNCNAPPRSWHCSACRCCVFKRDHHCNFFGCCVGYYNFRYFYMFVTYVFASSLYAMYFNLVYFARFIGFARMNWFSILYFLFPFASILSNLSYDNCFILLIGFNAVFMIFCGVLFVYHGRSLVRGKTAGECKNSFANRYNHGMKANFADAFGTKWYLIWLSPLLNSPMLGNGTSWVENPAFKNE